MANHDMWREWFNEESKYQAEKFGEVERQVHDKYMIAEGVGEGGLWHHDINAYLHRATILELNHATGRQALAKAAMTCIAAVESAVRVYGPLPEPGHPSGEIRRWKRGDNATI